MGDSSGCGSDPCRREELREEAGDHSDTSLRPPAPEEEADVEPGLPSPQTPLDDPIS